MGSHDATGRPPIALATEARVKTHLEDLQAEMEAGSRQLDAIAERASEMREAVLNHHLDQAALAGALIARVRDLQDSVQEQRERLRELRRAIRAQTQTAIQRRQR